MSKYKKFWGIIFSLFFFWLALEKTDLKAIPKSLSILDMKFFGLMIFSYTVEMVTRAHRWLIIQPNSKVNFKYSFFGLLLTFFFNNILPARAGEFFRPYYFSTKNLADSGETLGCVVLERFFDGIMILTLVLVSLNYFANNPLLQKAGIITALFYLGVLVFILLSIFKPNLIESITQYCFSIFPQKTKDFLENINKKFVKSFSNVKDSKRLVKLLLSSTICWLSSITTLWLCLKAFDFKEGFATASFMLTVLSISSMIPSSPGTLGVYEYFCIFVFTQILGYKGEEGAAFSIAMHGLQYIYVFIFGVIIALYEGVWMGKVAE